MLLFETSFHNHFLLFSYPILLPRCFTVSILAMCVWGVFHYRAPQGRNPPLVLTVDTTVFFLGWKITNQTRGCASHLLCFNCIGTDGITAKTQAAQGCVMSDEAIQGRGMCLRGPNEDWYAELHCSINREHIKRGNKHSRMCQVIGYRQ